MKNLGFPMWKKYGISQLISLLSPFQTCRVSTKGSNSEFVVVFVFFFSTDLASPTQTVLMRLDVSEFERCSLINALPRVLFLDYNTIKCLRFILNRLTGDLKHVFKETEIWWNLKVSFLLYMKLVTSLLIGLNGHRCGYTKCMNMDQIFCPKCQA